MFTRRSLISGHPIKYTENKNMKKDPKEVNSLITGLHTAAELAGVSLATDDQLREIADKVPFFEELGRDKIVPMPSLVGSWVQMFMEIEDAYHKSAKETQNPSDPNEVIRTIAKEIALAVHHYVSNATVATDVNTAVTGATGAGAPLTGTGVGKGIGKLS